MAGPWIGQHRYVSIAAATSPGLNSLFTSIAIKWYGMKCNNNWDHSHVSLGSQGRKGVVHALPISLQLAELGLEPGTIGARVRQMCVRAYVNASNGEKCYAKLVGRCRRYKTVCNSRLVLSRSCSLTFLAAGLTDYEDQDRNDEINKLMRKLSLKEPDHLFGWCKLSKKCRHVR